MINTLLLFICLFFTWLVLSGYFTPFFVIAGGVSCAFAVVIAMCIAKDTGRYHNLTGLLLRLPRYWLWLQWQIMVSSLKIAKQMWQTEPDISPTVEWVPSVSKDDIGLTIFANSITLTPGTVSIAVHPGMIQVHALNEDDMQSLRDGAMDRNVAVLVGTKK